jgi:hypothetical protein
MELPAKFEFGEGEMFGFTVRSGDLEHTVRSLCGEIEVDTAYGLDSDYPELTISFTGIRGTVETEVAKGVPFKLCLSIDLEDAKKLAHVIRKIGALREIEQKRAEFAEMSKEVE